MKFFSALIITLLSNIFSEAYASPKDEAEFLNRMIKHHQSGVHMSEVALQKSKNQEVLKLANKIKNEQLKEISQFSSWNNKWYKDIQVDSSTQPHDMKMMELDNKTGKDFDKEFLSMMSSHHRDGIEMTNQMKPNINRKELNQAANKIIINQSKEIKKIETIKQTIL